ncbi:MAG: hypothetical protein EOP85_15495 [Verrucomicrobiaceae bacterium]|nr:MAG: hypothetical protein EOP85_15495 [Verrucomicrobiaceae bacterium]
MKASVILTMLVLAAAGALTWRGHTRMVAATENVRRLEEQAAALGMIPGSTRPPSSRTGNRHAVDGKALASSLMFPGGKVPDRLATGRDLATLDAEGMRSFVREIFSSSVSDPEKRHRIVLTLVKAALADRPQTALLLLDAYHEAGGKTNVLETRELIPGILEKLAAQDATAALQWVRETSGRHPDLVSVETRRRVLTTLAAGDPKLAFREMDKIGLEEPQDALGAIMLGGNTRSQRLAVLDALRGHLSEIPDERLKTERATMAMQQFTYSTALGGIANARQWMAAAKFSPEEMELFAKGIANSPIPTGENGEWIECLTRAGAGTSLDKPVQDMMKTWTIVDYQAAGRWLTSAPGGPAKRAATETYAGMVAKYDPATAEKWALTLPEGKQRAGTLSIIHQEWPAGDAAGKTEFADRHGIR